MIMAMFSRVRTLLVGQVNVIKGNEIKEFYKGYAIAIVEDAYPVNPREDYSPLGLLVLREGGDKVKFSKGSSMEELVSNVQEELGPMVYLGVKRYSHSGDYFKAYDLEEQPDYPWNCPWDSGWAGIIAASKENIRKDYSCKRISSNLLERVKKLLKAEVEIYSSYVNGDCFGCVIYDSTGEVIDATFGYYGPDVEFALKNAREHIDWLLEEKSSGEQLSLGLVNE